MKLPALLLVVGLALAAGVGAWALAAATAPPPRPGAGERALERLAPAFLVELGAPELHDPRTALPRWHALDRALARTLASGACPAATGSAPGLEKALAWRRFACGEGELEETFFAAPPFLDPSGRSYVALAVATGNAPFTTPAWQRSHAHLAHALELQDLAVDDESLRALATLPRAALRSLARGGELAAGDALVLVREGNRAAGPPRFRALRRAEVDEALAEVSVALEGQRLVPRPLARGSVAAAAAAAASSLTALLAASALLAAGRLAQRRRALSDRVFMLRALTHELRTPATSLKLDLEALRTSYDELPGAAQEAVLRAVDDVERLDRVLAVSARALELFEGPAPFVPEELPSLASALEGVLDGEQVDYEADGPIRTDPRWLRIAVRNLVDNAHAHGAPPVRVLVRRDGAAAIVEVSDGGDSTALTRSPPGRSAHRRGRGSAGLGLGLTIVERIAHGLGGELRHHASPTVFTLRIRGRIPER